MDLLGLIMLLLGWGGLGKAVDDTARSNKVASVQIAGDGTPAPW